MQTCSFSSGRKISVGLVEKKVDNKGTAITRLVRKVYFKHQAPLRTVLDLSFRLTAYVI